MSNYMSIKDKGIKAELARKVAARLLARKGYEVLDACFDSGCNSFVVARDPEGDIAFVAPSIVDAFAEKPQVKRSEFELAALGWLRENPDTSDARIRFDDMQVCTIGGASKALVRYAENCEW